MSPRSSRRGPRLGALAAISGVAALATVAAGAPDHVTTDPPSSVAASEPSVELPAPLPLNKQLVVAADVNEPTTAPDPAGADLSRLADDSAVEAAAARAEPARTVWDDLADCEAGQWQADGGFVAGSANWSATAGQFEGGLQFHPSTWDAYRDADMPSAAYDATREQQIEVGERVRAAQGWRAWPVCSRKLGLR